MKKRKGTDRDRGGRKMDETLKPTTKPSPLPAPRKSEPSPQRFTTRKDLPPRPFLVRTQEEIGSRLDELRPVVAEYGRLKQAVEILNDIGPAPKVYVQVRSRDKESKIEGKTFRLVKRDQRRLSNIDAKLLATVKHQPGITVEQLGVRAKVTSDYLDLAVPALEAKGQLSRKGRRLYSKTS
jgi:hypothetical protein